MSTIEEVKKYCKEAIKKYNIDANKPMPTKL